MPAARTIRGPGPFTSLRLDLAISFLLSFLSFTTACYHCSDTLTSPTHAYSLSRIVHVTYHRIHQYLVISPYPLLSVV
jgi:hypothetical protein